MFSDFVRYQESDYSLISQIRRHNRVRLVHFYDPLEQGQTTYKGSKQVTDGSKTQWFNFSSNKEKEKLNHAFSAKQQQLQQMGLSLAIPYSSLSSAQPLMSQISGAQS